MLELYNRDKLINSIIYLVNNVSHCGKVKLFKLLYFLDFEHYNQTGRSVTGMEYFAWKMGPVPTELYEEIEAPEPDMAEILRFEMIPIINGQMLKIKIEIVQPLSILLILGGTFGLMAIAQHTMNVTVFSADAVVVMVVSRDRRPFALGLSIL